MKRPLATVIATLAFAMSMVVVLASSSSAEALTWGAPVDVAVTSGNSAPQIAVAPDGSATAVWKRFNGVNTIIQTATRPAGGSWGAAADLSATGQSANFHQIAVAPDGSATAVWIRSNGTNTIIQVATRPAGGSWGAAADLSATGQNASVPQIAVAADGSATAVWIRSNGVNNIVQAATRPAGGSWGAAADLSATGQNAAVPQIAVAADGSATAVWIRGNGTHSIVQAATRAAGGSWGAATDLSATGQHASVPQIAVAPDGSATAVWIRSNGTNTIVQAATRPAGGSWGAATDLSATGQDARAPQIDIAPDGSATAVWIRSNGTNNIVQAATRPAGGSWGAAADLSATGQSASVPQIDVAPDGSATAVWIRSNGTNTIVQAATRAAGGSWGAATDLSATGQDARAPQIDIAPDGSAAVVWDESNSEFIQAAVSAASSAVLTVATAGAGTGSVVSSPAGISCGATCSASFTLSSTVTLTAAPASGSTFAGWSGACTGTSTTCSVTIAGATSATATFTVTSATPAASDAAAATASTPTTTAAAPAPPSNRFRALSSRTVGTSIITSIRLPSAGRVTQRGVYRRVSSARRAACIATETVTRATTVTLICRLDAVATRRAVVVTTTFTPTGGTARTTTRTVMVSPPPPLPGVTG